MPKGFHNVVSATKTVSCRRGDRHDEVDLESHELDGNVVAALGLSWRHRARVNEDVRSLDIPALASGLAKHRLQAFACGDQAALHGKHADPRPVRRRCLGGKRCREDTAGKGNHDPDGALPHDRPSGRYEADLRLSMAAERHASGAWLARHITPPWARHCGRRRTRGCTRVDRPASHTGRPSAQGTPMLAAARR